MGEPFQNAETAVTDRSQCYHNKNNPFMDRFGHTIVPIIMLPTKIIHSCR